VAGWSISILLFQYVLGELGIEALAYAQNSPFIHSFIVNELGHEVRLEVALESV